MMEPKFELQKLQHSDKQKIGKHLLEMAGNML